MCMFVYLDNESEYFTLSTQSAVAYFLLNISSLVMIVGAMEAAFRQEGREKMYWL